MKTSDRIRVECLEKRKMLCRRHGLDSKKIEDLHSKIMAFLKALKIERLSKMIIESTEQMLPVLYSLHEIEELTEVKIIPKKRLFIELFYYLGLSEGLLSHLVQSIALILMENGHDIYDPQRMKFVKSYRDLDKISLFVKLQFLEEHGLKYLTETYNRKLRNCIAHLKLNLNDDGTITNKITGEKIEEEILLEEIHKLEAIGRIIIFTYQEALEIMDLEIKHARVQK